MQLSRVSKNSTMLMSYLIHERVISFTACGQLFWTSSEYTGVNLPAVSDHRNLVSNSTFWFVAVFVRRL
jgi:hypothetical protein